MSEHKHTNRLINETSPYLLQHAHNPVDWYSWGDDAFEKAKAEDKPVLLSIGYSACHWCHVMERESFEDEATAAIMNENFVNIKVDMEERPDIDKIYMNFVQMTTGSGGWPMTVFLTPDKLPFFGGTYFPPTPRYNMPSFQQILSGVSEAFRDKPAEILHSANDILGEMRRATILESSNAGVSLDILENAYQSLVRSFDNTNGGFGGAPKFPAAMSMEFLLRYYKRTGEEKALEMVTKTCIKMAQGGIYDQLGGGFHRYSVDSVWLVPHFEKMLYDNAQLARVYLHVYQITKDEFYKGIAVEILNYTAREMTDENGGFYSTQDADSEGVEGKFFVWTPKETEAILGEDDAKIFNYYYDVSKHGNFEEKNILNVRSSISEASAQLKITTEDLTKALEGSREKLFVEREKRIKPFRDEKMLTAWNGLMLAAFAEAGAAIDRKDYLEIAISNAEFVLFNLKKDRLLLRTAKDGMSKLNAYLEDYANYADGLIELYQSTGNVRWLKEAKDLAETMIAEFWDEESGGFYFTGKSHEELVVRSKDFYDNATPAGNNVAADVLLKLSKLTGNERYERFAVTSLRLVSGQIRRFPSAFGRALSVLEFHLNPLKEIVIIGDEAKELAREVWQEYLPGKVLVIADSDADASLIPVLEGRIKQNGKPTAYVCENMTCHRPVITVGELREQLAA